MNLVFASALEAQLFSMLLPVAVVIALITWYARSARHIKDITNTPAAAAPSAAAAPPAAAAPSAPSVSPMTQTTPPSSEGNEPGA